MEPRGRTTKTLGRTLVRAHSPYCEATGPIVEQGTVAARIRALQNQSRMSEDSPALSHTPHPYPPPCRITSEKDRPGHVQAHELPIGSSKVQVTAPMAESIHYEEDTTREERRIREGLSGESGDSPTLARELTCASLFGQNRPSLKPEKHPEAVALPGLTRQKTWKQRIKDNAASRAEATKQQAHDADVPPMLSNPSGSLNDVAVNKHNNSEALRTLYESDEFAESPTLKKIDDTIAQGKTNEQETFGTSATVLTSHEIQEKLIGEGTLTDARSGDQLHAVRAKKSIAEQLTDMIDRALVGRESGANSIDEVRPLKFPSVHVEEPDDDQKYLGRAQYAGRFTESPARLDHSSPEDRQLSPDKILCFKERFLASHHQGPSPTRKIGRRHSSSVEIRIQGSSDTDGSIVGELADDRFESHATPSRKRARTYNHRPFTRYCSSELLTPIKLRTISNPPRTTTTQRDIKHDARHKIYLSEHHYGVPEGHCCNEVEPNTIAHDTSRPQEVKHVDGKSSGRKVMGAKPCDHGTSQGCKAMKEILCDHVVSSQSRKWPWWKLIRILESSCGSGGSTVASNIKERCYGKTYPLTDFQGLDDECDDDDHQSELAFPRGKCPLPRASFSTRTKGGPQTAGAQVLCQAEDRGHFSVAFSGDGSLDLDAFHSTPTIEPAQDKAVNARFKKGQGVRATDIVSGCQERRVEVKATSKGRRRCGRSVRRSIATTRIVVTFEKCKNSTIRIEIRP